MNHCTAFPVTSAMAMTVGTVGIERVSPCSYPKAFTSSKYKFSSEIDCFRTNAIRNECGFICLIQVQISDALIFNMTRDTAVPTVTISSLCTAHIQHL